MAIEEQTQYDAWCASFFLETRTRLGQRLTVSNRIISKLAFVLEREGAGGSGSISFVIRRVSDDIIIATKVWGLVASIPTDPTWLDVTFASPMLVNAEVRLLAEYPDAYYLEYSNIRFYSKGSDVKPNEHYTNYQDDVWEAQPWDAAYRYTYILPAIPQAMGRVRGFDFRGRGFKP